MLTVKDHNDRAAATYAAVDGQYWIEAVSYTHLTLPTIYSV